MTRNGLSDFLLKVLALLIFLTICAMTGSYVAVFVAAHH
jgi:hypothetical protein